MLNCQELGESDVAGTIHRNGECNSTSWTGNSASSHTTFYDSAVFVEVDLLAVVRCPVTRCCAVGHDQIEGPASAAGRSTISTKTEAIGYQVGVGDTRLTE